MDRDDERHATVIEPSLPVLVYYLSRDIAAAMAALCWGLAAFLFIKGVDMPPEFSRGVCAGLIAVPVIYVYASYKRLAGSKYYVTHVIRFGKTFDQACIVRRNKRFKKRFTFGTLNYFFDVNFVFPREIRVDGDLTVNEVRHGEYDSPNEKFTGHTVPEMRSIIGIRRQDWGYMTGIVEGVVVQNWELLTGAGR